MIFYCNNRGCNLFKVLFVSFVVLGQCQIHLRLDADVVDHQALLLRLELSVHTGDGLDQVVFFERFVDVDAIQRRNIKTRQPHIDDDCDLEVGF